METVKSCLEEKTKLLKDNSITTPRLEARLLLAKAVNKDLNWTYLNLEKRISKKKLSKYKILIEKKLKKSESETRKNQVGTGDRSERIRTYNFPQGRVTDHRINLTLHKLEQVLSGESLDEIIDKLLTEDKAIKLANLN